LEQSQLPKVQVEDPTVPSQEQGGGTVKVQRDIEAMWQIDGVGHDAILLHPGVWVVVALAKVLFPLGAYTLIGRGVESHPTKKEGTLDEEYLSLTISPSGQRWL